MKMTNEIKAINHFCERVDKARRVWETSGGDHHSWISFYEEKVDALDEFREKIPQISAIDQFWTWLFSISVGLWPLMIAKQIESIKAGIPCMDCGTTIPWPAHRCEKCAGEHKKFLEEKREIQKRLRKIKRKALR